MRRKLMPGNDRGQRNR